MEWYGMYVWWIGMVVPYHTDVVTTFFLFPAVSLTKVGWYGGTKWYGRPWYHAPPYHMMVCMQYHIIPTPCFSSLPSGVLAAVALRIVWYTLAREGGPFPYKESNKIDHCERDLSSRHQGPPLY